MKTEREILVEAYSLLEKGWVKDMLAQSMPSKRCVNPAGGDYVEQKDKTIKHYAATHFSITGAILAAEGSRHLMFSTKAYLWVDKIANQMGHKYIHYWEDPPKTAGRRTQDDVLTVMGKAIDLASA